MGAIAESGWSAGVWRAYIGAEDSPIEEMPMRPLHIALAIGLTIIWGANFVAVRVGLDHYPPLFFAVIRFCLAGLPILFLPRRRSRSGVFLRSR